VHDALIVALGVEPLNLVQDVKASHDWRADGYSILPAGTHAARPRTSLAPKTVIPQALPG
jgi:hypothetical protein